MFSFISLKHVSLLSKVSTMVPLTPHSEATVYREGLDCSRSWVVSECMVWQRHRVHTGHNLSVYYPPTKVSSSLSHAFPLQPWLCTLWFDPNPSQEGTSKSVTPSLCDFITPRGTGTLCSYGNLDTTYLAQTAENGFYKEHPFRGVHIKKKCTRLLVGSWLLRPEILTQKPHIN